MFKNKNIVILGMARSGYEVAKLLSKYTNNIVINDMKEEQNFENVQELKKLGVKIILGNHPEELINDKVDFLIKNPGIRNDHTYVRKANELNIPVINEVEVAYLLLPKDITLIGITGSNGKTTTTSIIYEIIKKSGKKCHLTGNIGFPLSGFVEKIQPKDIIVMEVSIQQLCNLKKFKTNISVLTNIYEAHLDFVGCFENYLNTKKKIFNHHNNSDYAILNYDNVDVIKISNDILSQKIYFSTLKKLEKGCYLKNQKIYYNNKVFINVEDLKIRGMHNYENIMGAILVAKKLDISDEIIIKTLKEFKGVEHRIEYVKELNNRKFYNDSKSTNVIATKTALKSFDDSTILLLGGLDRGHLFDDLKEDLNNVSLVVAYGETKNRIKAFCDFIKKECIVCENLENAVVEAYKNSKPKDIILLSPACASWDQFEDFEKRGNKFKEIIEKL